MHYLTKKAEVFPCPFCGKSAHLNMGWDNKTNLLVEGWVECGTCETRSPTAYSWEKLEDYLVIWNRCSILSVKLNTRKYKKKDKREKDQLLLELEC